MDYARATKGLAEAESGLEGYLCVSCHLPLARQDFVDMGLPLPRLGETAEAYTARTGNTPLIHADCQFGCVPGSTSC